MFLFKACPKCQGDMYTDRDQYGSFIECIHCGLIRDVKVNWEIDKVPAQVTSSLALTRGQSDLSLAA